jgi:PKD repeat protein
LLIKTEIQKHKYLKAVKAFLGGVMKCMRIQNSVFLMILFFTVIMILPFAGSNIANAQIAGVHRVTGQEITLMSFNTWVSGTNVTNGQNKILNAILASGADIVGLSEVDEDFGTVLADKLHWYKYSNLDNCIISRFPIGKTWNSMTGAGAEIVIENNKKIAVHTVHLTYTPYGPYTACLDEADYNKIYDDEESSGRVAEITDALAAVHAYVQDGTPMFLLGDLNSPSHLDWVDAAADQHCMYAVEWPVTIKIQEEGLIDSYRQRQTDPVAAPGITWSPIYHNWLYPSGKPEPMDRIDYIFYSGENVQLGNPDVFTYGTTEQYPLHLNNEWPSDHAAVVSSFNIETGAQVSNRPVAKFYAYFSAIKEGMQLSFIDISTNSPTNWSWTFEGGTPAQSSERYPSVTYPSAGEFGVTLIATNAAGSDTIHVNGLIKVEQATVPAQLVLNKKVYSLFEPITATFSDGPGNPTDWVGIYRPGDTPGAVWSTLWYYVNGSQTAGEGLTDGSVTFADGLMDIGTWWAGFFINDGYALLDSLTFDVVESTGVKDGVTIPKTLSLSNYPNPFNPETKIVFNLPKEEDVFLDIYDTRGATIATLVHGKMSKGEHTVAFNGNDLASGVYFYRLQVGGQVLNKKMLLLR